jgi:hypothetical protein
MFAQSVNWYFWSIVGNPRHFFETSSKGSGDIAAEQKNSKEPSDFVDSRNQESSKQENPVGCIQSKEEKQAFGYMSWRRYR